MNSVKMPYRSALALALLMTVVSCGKAEEAPAPQSAANPTNTETAAAAPDPAAPQVAAAPTVTCADVFGKMAGDKAGSTEPLPHDFPPPPSGSTLCGETFMHEVWYLNSSNADNDMIDYYRKALTAQGYSVDPVSNGGGGSQRLDFTRSGVNGYVAFNGDKDHMAMKYKDVIKIAYHSLTK